jgi:tRNA threonylcarbamoyladenosine biosynthesis protein TsaB
MKPIILHIETSGEICSVCLSLGEDVLGIRESSEANNHAKNLAPFVDALLKETNISTEALDAVSISMGPGSYTGLRIGISLAKAICYTSDVPLIGISTLEAMVNGIKANYTTSAEKLFCPMIDARRMEVYTAIYNGQNKVVMDEQPMILKEDNFSDFDMSQVIFFGSGAQKVKVNYPESRVADFTASSLHLVTPALKNFKEQRFEDVAYFEPNYIKPFYSPAPKPQAID